MIRFYQKDYEQALLKDVSVDYIHEAYNYKNRYGGTTWYQGVWYFERMVYAEVDLTKIGIGF